MYLLITDETNQQPSESVCFFIYGGIVIPEESFMNLHDGIELIRNRYGFLKSDEFKFDTRTRPKSISIEYFAKAKNDLIALCINLHVVFIVYVIHHDIQKNQELEQKLEWAADYIIGRFNLFLQEKGDYGFCIIDNLPTKSQYKYLVRKFTEGNNVEGKLKAMNNISMFATTCSNASHYSSAMDIILGSFRYCINNPKNVEAAQEMLNNVTIMMWGEHDGKEHKVIGKGFIFRPKIEEIKSPKIKKEYEQLLARLNDLLNSNA